MRKTDRKAIITMTSLLDPPVVAPFIFPTVKIGGRAAVSCNAISGSGSLEFSWLKDGKPLIAPHIDILRSKLSSSLEFDGIKSEDAGEYKCIVKNPAGNAFHSSRLVIEGKDSY